MKRTPLFGEIRASRWEMVFWVVLGLVAATAFVTGLGYLDRGGVSLDIYSGDPLPRAEAGPAATGGTVALFLDAPRGGGRWVDAIPSDPSLEPTAFPRQVSFVPRAGDDQVLQRAFLATRPGHFTIRARFQPAGGQGTVDYPLAVAVRETSALGRIFAEVAPIALLLVPTMLIARGFLRHRRASSRLDLTGHD
jgi:hypothetical protein